MPLNEQLTWNEVGAISTGGTGTVADAFQLGFGLPSTELLPAGMSLYKFNGFRSLGQASRRNTAKEGKGGKGGLPGGGTQFYIPNLTVGDIVNPSFRPL